MHVLSTHTFYVLEILSTLFIFMDREEMPFNRAERNWVYNAANNEDTMLAFGSTKNLTPVGTPIFVSCAFPTLEEDAIPAEPMEIGPNCRNPYKAKSFFNISAMSYGSISKPAIQALSKGAAMAGCWLNTGEGGGLAPYHYPADKAVKIYNHAKNMLHEVEVIAHSCGVHEPRQLKRYHVRIMQERGFSIPLDKLFPVPAKIYADA